MPEKMPERIVAARVKAQSKVLTHPIQVWATSPIIQDKDMEVLGIDVYLRSTPMLEHAEEMRDYLSWLRTLHKMGEISLTAYASPYTDGACDQSEKMFDLLATIEKEEEVGK